MKLWSDFLPLVLPSCPGCPDLVAEDEIRNAAEQFLAESKAWRYWVLGVVGDSTAVDYQLMLPLNTRAVKLHQATLDTEALKIQPTYAGEYGAPYKVAMTETIGWVRIGPEAPADGQIMTFEVSLSITSDATGINSDLFDTYRMGIALGAIARICDTKGKPYSDPQMAMEKRAEFGAAISKARGDRAKGNSSYTPRATAALF
jgi:hypothetical protein